jgi:hypothetical protein
MLATVLVCLGIAPALAQQAGPGKVVATLGNEHIEAPSSPHLPYNSDPPTSGPHVPYIAKWGVHKQPVEKEIQVHNLEDGGVMVQYNCQKCDDLIAKLEALTSEFNHIIVAPYPTGKFVIALTAWGRIDTLDGLDEARIRRFIKAYMGIDHHVRHP